MMTMQPHQHEPDPDSYLSVGNLVPAGILDSDAYPLIATCQLCLRRIRCDRINASWHTAEQRERLTGFPVPGSVKYGL
jgi:hypothetical protein